MSLYKKFEMHKISYLKKLTIWFLWWGGCTRYVLVSFAYRLLSTALCYLLNGIYIILLTEGEGSEEEDMFGNTGKEGGKIGAKKQKKLQEKAEKKAARLVNYV